ncbi:hypothetical protein HMPREF9151_02162 [Hoylesella saccharolytica F0055]|uniref:Uncharacterized protein n=1 Tax=Hoylesella saccharolytica F0055 TaxID=1127699 RepID=L1N1V4_9BACT|nr:hypothetical protein HMPREF9151_02162 [Hoylesella saccharolytica F0055]
MALLKLWMYAVSTRTILGKEFFFSIRLKNYCYTKKIKFSLSKFVLSWLSNALRGIVWGEKTFFWGFSRLQNAKKLFFGAFHACKTLKNFFLGLFTPAKC